MNPFVTNPHLLKPGDLITLIEKEDMHKKKGAEKPLAVGAKPAPRLKGIDMGFLTNTANMGYLSLTKVEPWGEIYQSARSELGAEKGDKVFINFKNREGVKPGDAFRVAKPMPVRHPLTGYPLGEIISFRGAVVVKEYLKEDFFLAEVTEVWLEFGVGAMILPFEPLSKCVQPLATDPKLYGNVVALKDDRKIVGAGTVVYLDAGFKDGIQRGQVFDVVRITKIASPAFRMGNFEEIVNEVGSTLLRTQYLADFWKEINEGTKLYDHTVGKIMIIESRPASSAGIVLSSSEDLYTGAFIKGFSWSEMPEFLSNLPSCPVE
jgi:hypothetical protein